MGNTCHTLSYLKFNVSVNCYEVTHTHLQYYRLHDVAYEAPKLVELYNFVFCTGITTTFLGNLL